MKSLTSLTSMRSIGVFLIIFLFTNCKKDLVATSDQETPGTTLRAETESEISTLSTLSQTRTANLFNQFGEAILALWASGDHQSLAADDDIYAYSKKLGGRKTLALQLHDFRFEIPADATIESIVLTVKRFKTGKVQSKIIL